MALRGAKILLAGEDRNSESKDLDAECVAPCTLAAPAPAAIENPNVTAGIEILSDF